MLHIFLQVEQAVAESVFSRLADQGFSIVLLVVFAAYSLRRQKQIEDKLEKYMEEDRQEMKEVIQKNTQAFERIAPKIMVLVIALGLCLTSCLPPKTTGTAIRAVNREQGSICPARESTTIFDGLGRSRTVATHAPSIDREVEKTNSIFSWLNLAIVIVFGSAIVVVIYLAVKKKIHL